MRMIRALPRTRFERKSARDDRAVRRAQRIEHRLLDRCGIDVGGERFAADENVDAPRGIVADDRDVGRAVTRADFEHCADHQDDDQRCAIHHGNTGSMEVKCSASNSMVVNACQRTRMMRADELVSLNN